MVDDKNNATKAEKPRTARWVKVVLGVSLALNLAVLGLVAGAMTRSPRHGDGGGIARYAMPYVIALPREDRREMFKTVRAETDQGQIPSRSERRKLYEDMLNAIEAEPFDRETAKAIFTRQTQATLLGQEAAQEAWLKQIESYDVAERRAYAERIREVLKRGGKRKGHSKK